MMEPKKHIHTKINQGRLDNNKYSESLIVPAIMRRERNICAHIHIGYNKYFNIYIIIIKYGNNKFITYKYVPRQHYIFRLQDGRVLLTE
jgi:hypothetical protein